MTQLLRCARLTTLVAALALAGGVIAAGSTPAAHASSTPRITAGGGDGYVYVSGSGFTAGGNVRIALRIYNPLTAKWQADGAEIVTASPSVFHCVPHSSPPLCFWTLGGLIRADLVSQPGTVRATATDLSTGDHSNVVTTTVLPIP